MGLLSTTYDGPNTTALAVQEYRRLLVARYRLQGLTIAEIQLRIATDHPEAHHNGQPPGRATLSHDLDAINIIWRAEMACDLSAHKERVFHEIQLVKRMAFETAELETVLSAIKQERELLGLDAIKSVNVMIGVHETLSDKLERLRERLVQGGVIQSSDQVQVRELPEGSPISPSISIDPGVVDSSDSASPPGSAGSTETLQAGNLDESSDAVHGLAPGWEHQDVIELDFTLEGVDSPMLDDDGQDPIPPTPGQLVGRPQGYVQPVAPDGQPVSSPKSVMRVSKSRRNKGRATGRAKGEKGEKGENSGKEAARC